jgi:glycosyltransferase involved in cell wall biosynthesis
VEAVSRLAIKHPNVYLVICGDGREKNRLEALIGKDGLVNRAKLIPSHPDITGIFSILDVFVHPATFREGFGLTLLEAMAAKIPVVASNIWAINSIIRNHVNGFLVQPKNAKELADTLSYIMENQTISGSIAQNGFEMASRDYSVDRMAGEMETVYEEVLSETRRA